MHTAISINVVGLNLPTYESRPNGAMGIYCNSHITIGHVLNEQGTGYEHIFSTYEHSISIELKMGHVI